MRSLIVLFSFVAAGACVKGNPLELVANEDRIYDGGTLEIEDCGYSVTTRSGAEEPRFARGVDALPGANPSPRHVHLGFIGDPKESMVAQWRTEDDITRTTMVRFAEGEDLAESELTSTGPVVVFAYRATGAEVYTVHQAHMCGLKPGTAYSYQVGSTGHFSPVYTFRTAPDVEANPDAVSVIGNLGDSRDGYEVWTRLVDQLRARTPDLILFSGDAVTIGLSQLEWEEFFDRGEPLLARVPIITAHGNHEVNAVNFFSQFAMPGDQETFGFDWGHAHITVANDTPSDPSQIAGQFRETIAADFAASANARWKLFTHHQPIYSASTRHGSSMTLKAAWEPLIDQYEIDLVLNGHDHCYEITHPMRANVKQATNATGTVYAVMGGAGADLYDNGMDTFTEYSEKTYGAATIRISRNEMVMDAFRDDGTPITCNTCAYPTGMKKVKN